jgi:hypothetical protein
VEPELERAAAVRLQGDDVRRLEARRRGVEPDGEVVRRDRRPAGVGRGVERRPRREPEDDRERGGAGSEAGETAG